jgi:predicted ATPase
MTGQHTIRTPDQRLRVFISSTLGELADERAAVRDAVTALRLAPVMFELGARPHPPRDLYRAYLAQSDVFVGLYWERYGWVAPDMDVSGLEDEYDQCGDLPRLLYVKEPAPGREPRLVRLIARIEAEGLGSYRVFNTAAELGELVREDLATLLSERFLQPPEVHPRASAPVLPRLPAPATSLIGRERDLAQVCALARQDEVRLITLTGPGGIGKTRLALAAAEALKDDYPDGVAFVTLGSVREPRQVLPAVADAVSASMEHTQTALDGLKAHYEGRAALLVLDNLEQVVDAGPDLVSLLAACPGLTVLATSRTVLRLRGEHEYPVPALDLPPPGSCWLDEMAATPAVALFVDRAQAARPEFRLTWENVVAIAEICRRLDGIPLAIELAAARSRLLSPHALLARLSGCLDSLGTGPADLPDRQRTLRATVAWSFNLLSPPAARTLTMLGCFTDGWTLEAAAAVCELDDLDALQILDDLAGHSLIMLSPTADEPRFRMLGTVREFALELLDARPDAEAVRARHAAYFTTFAERADRPLRSGEQAAWVALLHTERGNLRTAITWLLAHGEHATVAHLGRVLWLYWWRKNQLADALPWLEELMAHRHGLDALGRAETLWAFAATAMELGHDELVLSAAEEAAPLIAELDEPYLQASAALVTAMILPLTGDVAGALAAGQQALAMLREADEPFLLGLALTAVGSFHMVVGDLEDARRLQAEAMAFAEQLGDERLWAQAKNQAGLVELLDGDLARTRDLLDAGAAVFLDLEDTEGLCLSLFGYGWLAVTEGDARRAALALGAARAEGDRCGLKMWPTLRDLYDSLLEGTRQQLGEEAFEEAFELGTVLPRSHAMEAARGRAAAAIG